MNTHPTERPVRRRRVLGTAGGAILGALAGCASGGGTTATDASAGEVVDSYLSGVSNYDGTIIDRTGTDSVRVEVGTQGNGGNFAYTPAAVRIDPGTTVVWDWTGKGNQHNVVEESGGYESELHVDAGVHFERAFDSTGVSRYFCTPHRGLGMKGAVVVE